MNLKRLAFISELFFNRAQVKEILQMLTVKNQCEYDEEL